MQTHDLHFSQKATITTTTATEKKYDYSDEDRLSCKSFTTMLSNT